MIERIMLLNHEFSICSRSRVNNFPPEFLQLNRNTRPEPFDENELAIFQNAIRSVDLTKYPNCEDFLGTLSKYYGFPQENISITSGIDGGIKAAIETFTKPGDKIAYLTPCYIMYRVYSNAFALSSIEIECDNNLKYSLDAIFKSIRSGIKIFFLTNPHSPVDFSISQQDFKLLLEEAKRYGVLIFVDEAYHHFGADSFLNILTDGVDNLIVARTFSKAFCLPGIRVGTLFSNPNLAKALNSKRLSYETNTLSLVYAAAALKNDFYVYNYARSVSQSREYLKEKMGSLGLFTINENLNSILVNVNSNSIANKIIYDLQTKKVIIRTLPDRFENYLLIGLGRPSTATFFWENFEEIFKKNTNSN